MHGRAVSSVVSKLVGRRKKGIVLWSGVIRVEEFPVGSIGLAKVASYRRES